jgi:hypothetical protein
MQATMALTELLAASSTSAPNILKMSRKERMTLAVILSSSYLQLEATPWLKETWSKDDILFEKDLTSTITRPIDIERPYIAITFRPEPLLPSITNNLNSAAANVTQSTITPAPSPGNPGLLALGIMLLELYTGQAFENCNFKLSIQAGPVLDFYLQQLQLLGAASQWLNTVQEDLSAGYTGAVLHCIRSYFDPVRTAKDEAIFRQTVYDQVLLPLEKELRSFLGES